MDQSSLEHNLITLDIGNDRSSKMFFPNLFAILFVTTSIVVLPNMLSIVDTFYLFTFCIGRARISAEEGSDS